VGSLYLSKKNKMPTDITINNITGSAPFDVYLCDNPITTCVYVDTISSTPYVFEIPSIMSSQNDFNLKIVDNNNCTVIETLSLL
jgi:hypothetical protein